jgi:hypothetical protein
MGPRALLILAAAVLSVQTATAATITGTVTAADTGRALGGMVVSAYTPAGDLLGSASTDSFGRYNLTVPAGLTRVLAYDPAGVYATSYYSNATAFETSETFTLTASQAVSGINFSLLRGGRITGRVLDEQTRVALSWMTVAAYTLAGVRRERVQSDGGGYFALLLPPGDYIIASWDEQFTYVPEFYENASKASLATVVKVSAGGTVDAVDFTLSVGARISGTVSDRPTGQALSAITITAYDSAGGVIGQTRSDDAGSFAMAVPPGALRLVAHDDTGTYAGSFFNEAEAFELGTVLQLARGDTAAGLQFRMDIAGRVAGRVTNASTGAGLQALVIVYNLSGTRREIVRTDPSGAFTSILPPGHYKLAAVEESGLFTAQFWSGKASFGSADPLLVIAQQPTPASFALALAARISGSVIERTSGKAIGGMTVAAIDSHGVTAASSSTDASGNYTLLLPGGSYRLMATDPTGRHAAGFEGSATTLETAPARTLNPGEAVSGVILRSEANGPAPSRRRPASRSSTTASEVTGVLPQL